MARSKVKQLMQVFSLDYQFQKEMITGVVLLDAFGEIIYHNSTFRFLNGDKSLEQKQVIEEKIAKTVQLNIKKLLAKGDIIKTHEHSLQLPIDIDHDQELCLKCSISNRLQEKSANAIIISYHLFNQPAQIEKAQEKSFSWIKVLESVVTKIKDGVVLIEANSVEPANTKIVFVNKSFVKISGYQAKEVIGSSSRFLKAVFYCPQQLQTIKNAMKKHKAFEITLTTIKKNDLITYTDCSFMPLTNELGLHTHWIAIVKDITEKKQMEEVWRKESILTGFGSWSYEIDSQQIYWSETAKQIYQVEPSFEPTIANTAHFFKFTKANQYILKQIGNSFLNALPFDIEIEILTAKNNKKWIRILGEPQFVNNNCKRITGTFQDIDVRKQAELLAAKITQERNEILESIGDGFFAVNKQWKVIFWNSKAAQELERSKEELMNQNLWEVFSEAVGSYAYEQYHLAMKTKKPVHFQGFAKSTQVWYDISAYPTANGLAVYFKNITLQKLDQLKIIDSEKRFSDLFQLSPLPKWVFDLNTFRFLDVNIAAIKHYGFSHKEFMKMTIFDIRPASEKERLEQVLHNSRLKKEFIDQGLFTHQKKNKELIRVSIQSALVNFKGHEAKLIIANDITEQEKYIQAIEQQNEKLKEVAWIQSHVFRAPLSKIMGLIEILKSTDEKERALAITYIEDAAMQLDQAIKEITNRSKTNSVLP